MKKLKKQVSGLSLIEVLASIGIAAITVGAFTQYAILTAGSRSDADKQRLVKETLLNNVLEIKGNPISSLPAPNQCRIRKYDPLGVFITEWIVTDISNFCGISPDPNYYFVFTRVLPATSISATFSNPATMKLPQYSNLMVQVNLNSLFKGNNGSTYKDEISIFKR